MADIATLPMLLKELKLSAIGGQWEALAHKALDEQWPPQQYLAALCEHECASRLHKRLQRYTRESKLPPGKRLSNFDTCVTSGIKANQITALAKHTEWVGKAENVMLFGASGLGKTHLAAGMGYALIEADIRVKFSSAGTLVQELQKARSELKLAEALVRLDKYAVLIVDDIGYVKKDEQETQVLFELIAHRYETGSMIITSNQPFSAWDRIFDDTMMTVAAIDRLVHHAHILELSGESYRKRASLIRQKEVKTAKDD